MKKITQITTAGAESSPLWESLETYAHSGLQYNDASLQFGGLFDYAWETTPWNLPHAGHREGMHTDLRIYADMVNHLPDLSGAQLRHVKKYWKDALGGTIHLETDHWHLVHP